MNCKIILIITVSAIILLAGCDGSRENYFKGTIEYAYSYSSDSLNIDSLSKVRPVKGLFRYDTAGYQSRFVGPDTVTYYYSGGLNKCVSQNGSQKNYECEDYGTATDSVLSVKLYDTEEKVLGYNCKIIELQKTRSFVKYFLSTEIKMGPSTYQRHRSFNWDIYGERSGGGLVLKLEHRFKNFTMHGVATAIGTGENKFTALEIDEKLMAELCAEKK